MQPGPLSGCEPALIVQCLLRTLRCCQTSMQSNSGALRKAKCGGRLKEKHRVPCRVPSSHGLASQTAEKSLLRRTQQDTRRCRRSLQSLTPHSGNSPCAAQPLIPVADLTKQSPGLSHRGPNSPRVSTARSFHSSLGLGLWSRLQLSGSSGSPTY